jgi:two-component system sensor histidine kinase/response regulator
MDNQVILIVDDERSNQFLLEGLLNAQGYTTILAANGVECIDKLKEQLVDLILLDIMMPRMTGIEALEKIVSNEPTRHIPVIMLSAKTSTKDIEEALGKGAIDYIKKPFDEIELLSRVKVGLRLKQNEDRLREMIRQREELVKIISHDLRSPFTAINGLAELLLGDTNLTKEQKESLGFIIDSVSFSQDYFNKLLGWTRIEHQYIELNLMPVSLFKIVNIAVRFYDKKASEKGIEITNSVDETIIVKVDDTYFRQVIVNLLNNAIKFTNKNGWIQMMAKYTESGLDFKISDNGIGMPVDLNPEDLLKADLLKSRRGTAGEKGTGLGLSICKKIIDAHGFVLTFYRKNEGGTDFVIRFPKTALVN